MNTQWIRAAGAVRASLTLAVLSACCVAAHADTVAYWRFEDGPAGTDVVHLAGDAGEFSRDVTDVSGSGNDLSVWETGGGGGYGYRTDIATNTIAATGAANNYSVQNTGGGPAMFAGEGDPIQTMAPEAFTIEASFKLENGGFRTVVGRDATDVADINRELAAVYFQAVPGNAFAVKFADQDGFWHEAVSDEGIINTFAFPNAAEGDWYHAAGVSDGSTLSLYLANASQGTGYQLIAQTDLTVSGSTNTALTAGAGDGADWNAGNWSVGRGLYNGGHGDRAWGFIDEVRISDDAVAMTDLLHFGSTQNLTIEVNTSTGEVVLRNSSSGSVTLDYYEIESAGGSLTASGWNSLDDQDVEAQTPGDYNTDGTVDAADYTVYRDGLGTTFAEADYNVWAENYGAGGEGYGWTEAGGSDANILSELLLDAAGTTLTAGQEYSLGVAFDTGVGAQDLVFRYGRPGGSLFNGGVSYVSSAVAIPEPASAVLVVLGAALALTRRAG